jgi:hypothetical protein
LEHYREICSQGEGAKLASDDNGFSKQCASGDESPERGGADLGRSSAVQAADDRPERTLAVPTFRSAATKSDGDLTGRYATNELQPKHFADVAMVVLSAGMRSLLRKAEGADLSQPAEHRAPGEIIPEWWAASSRNRGRLPSEIRTRLLRPPPW